MMMPLLTRVQHTQVEMSQERKNAARGSTASARATQMEKIDKLHDTRQKAVEEGAKELRKKDAGSIIGGLLGAVAGAIVGFCVGGPVGAVVGAAVGAAAGSPSGRLAGDLAGGKNRKAQSELERTAGYEQTAMSKAQKAGQSASENMRDALAQREQVETFSRQVRQAALEQSQLEG